MDCLRNEINDSQKSRTELMKWKFIVVAGLGAAGLGLTRKPMESIDVKISSYILCCIPFACAYVDLLCRHLFCRILVIGKFCELHADNEHEYLKTYELLANSARCMSFKISAYAMENIALWGSSLFICSSLIYIYYFLFKMPVLLFCGIIGIIITLTIEIFFRFQKYNISNLEEIELENEH